MNKEIITVFESDTQMLYQVANVQYLYEVEDLALYRLESGMKRLIAKPCHSPKVAEDECIADWFFCQHGCATPFIEVMPKSN